MEAKKGEKRAYFVCKIALYIFIYGNLSLTHVFVAENLFNNNTYNKGKQQIQYEKGTDNDSDYNEMKTNREHFNNLKFIDVLFAFLRTYGVLRVNTMPNALHA